MKRVNLYVDNALWVAFRMACLAHRTSASKAIVALIQKQLVIWQTGQEGATND